MAFDPLAFMKPNKAFSMEGLLSRDMFEKFAADEEDEQLTETYEDGESEDDSDRCQFLSDCIIDKASDVVHWMHEWDCLKINMASSIIIIYGISGSEWASLYELVLDDGPPVETGDIIHTMDLIRQGLLEWIDGIAITETEQCMDVDTVIYSFSINSI